MLPSMLESPELQFPRIVSYEQLESRYHEDQVSCLERVDGFCNSSFGDGYELFAFTFHGYPTIAALKCLRIHFNVQYDDKD